MEMDKNLVLALVIGVPLIAYFVGQWIAKLSRMPEHGWVFGLILASIGISTVVVSLWNPKLGIDLRGGVILIYEVDDTSTAQMSDNTEPQAPPDDGPNGRRNEDQVRISELVEALQQRVNPSGVKDVVIRPYGSKQVEIIVPEVEPAEIASIKERIVTGGYLKFQIVANEQDHATLAKLADEAQASDKPAVRNAKVIRRNGEIVAEWVAYNPADLDVASLRAVRTRSINGEHEVLMAVDSPELRVEGSHLKNVYPGFDDQKTFKPCLHFAMNQVGSLLFHGLTSKNLPDEERGFYRHLGIVLDSRLMSAPSINSAISGDGQITGNFTQKEIDQLVGILRAGRLPAVLHKEPISENEISPLLGADMIASGKMAIGGSLAIVIAFMLAYYRFAGIVASVALLINLLITVALMILVGGAFTLPGLAGIVLTVGMSVDANVLIYERIREELAHGAALRMAIRNGFSRATTTIIDSNLTTVITAIALYAFGTDQIRGFAVTLILGLLVSMYTAIFCTRAIMDFAEKTRWIRSLNMLKFWTGYQVDFVSLFVPTTVASLIVIAIGMGAVVMRGTSLLGIDLAGGSSVQTVLKEPRDIGWVRARAATLADEVSVTQINARGFGEQTVYQIDSTNKVASDLQDRVQKAFRDDRGESLLRTYSMKFSPPTAPTAQLPDRNMEPTFDGAKIPASILAAVAVSEKDKKAGSDEKDDDQKDASDGKEQKGGDGVQDTKAAPKPETTPPVTAEAVPTNNTDVQPVYLSQCVLTFKESISHAALKQHLSDAERKSEIPIGQLELTNPAGNSQSQARYETWQLRSTASIEETAKVLETLQQQLEGSPIWLSSTQIGGKVAGNLQTQALGAMAFSLLGILGYVWARFHYITHGVAAIIALIHDVLVALGAVALSHWLAPMFGVLLVDDFKVSLTVVAALLTIVGFSINDTIVIFDRIREVKGKSQELTKEMINRGLNETLSRTIITSGTVFLATLILYCLGGEGIHGFAFCMLVGVIAGSYSSLFVAAPIMLWLANWASDKPASARAK